MSLIRAMLVFFLGVHVLKPSTGLKDVSTVALGCMKQCSGLETKETMSLFKAVLLCDSPLARSGSSSSGWL